MKNWLILLGAAVVVYWLIQPADAKTPLTTFFGFNPSSPPAQGTDSGKAAMSQSNLGGDSLYT